MMQHVKQWWLAAFTATWILFALICLFFSPVWSGQANVLKAFVGLIGMGLLLVYLLARRYWTLLACIGSGVALVAAYVVDWTIRADEYLSVDPELGVLGTIWQFVSTPLAVAVKLMGSGAILQALIEIYWALGMPLLLTVIIALWITRIGVVEKS